MRVKVTGPVNPSVPGAIHHGRTPERSQGVVTPFAATICAARAGQGGSLLCVSGAGAGQRRSRIDRDILQRVILEDPRGSFDHLPPARSAKIAAIEWLPDRHSPSVTVRSGRPERPGIILAPKITGPLGPPILTSGTSGSGFFRAALLSVTESGRLLADQDRETPGAPPQDHVRVSTFFRSRTLSFLTEGNRRSRNGLRGA